MIQLEQAIISNARKHLNLVIRVLSAAEEHPD